MRIDMRKVWKCIAWVGPHGEVGHGIWLPSDHFAQDEQWCRHMDALYPGWRHFIQQNRGTPEQKSIEGWVQHPLFGDMEHGPMGL